MGPIEPSNHTRYTTCPHRLGESSQIVCDRWVLEVCILRAMPIHNYDTNLVDGQSLYALPLVGIV